MLQGAVQDSGENMAAALREAGSHGQTVCSRRAVYAVCGHICDPGESFAAFQRALDSRLDDVDAQQRSVVEAVRTRARQLSEQLHEAAEAAAERHAQVMRKLDGQHDEVLILLPCRLLLHPNYPRIYRSVL
jgi:hypothetical protein